MTEFVKKVNYVWEQRKLGEITDVRDGTHDSPKYVQEGHPFITSKNVSNGFINYDDVQYVTDADYQKINRRSKVEVHDILMGMIGTIGNLALIQKEPDFAIKNVALIKYTGDVDYEYLYQALQADCVTNQLFTGMDGGTQKFVSLKKIRELDIPFPEEWEQKKIGDYFSNLDHLITLHQRKICIFIKKLPIDWEQRKLNEVAEFNPKSDLPESFEYVDLESVVGTEMVSHRTETKETAPSRAQRLAQTGDVFFQTVRPYQRNNYLFTKPDNNYVFSTGYAHMRPKIDAEFLMCFLQTDSFVKVVLDNCTGTSYPAINSNDLSNLEIDLPTSEDEQRRIGCFITNLDHLITLHHRECVILRKMKVNDWEQRKLGDLVLDHNAGIYISKENYGEGINVIGVGNIYDSDIFNGEIYRLGPVNDDKFLLEEDDIIYGESSLVPEGIARTVCVGKNGAGSAFAWHTRRVKLDNNIVNSHVATLELNYLHDVRKYLVSVSTQTALTGITTDGYFGTTLVLPSVEEQHKISDYFKSLDHLITLHHRKGVILRKKKVNDWEQRKLGEIATETYGGGTPKTSNEEFWKGDIPWIQSSDLIDECLFDVRPRKCISQEAVSKSATKLVPQNSIAIVTRVGVGKLAFMPFSYATSQDFLSLSGLKIDPEFTVYALYKMMQSVSNEVQGTSIKGVTKDELLAKKITFPSCNEQEKIGAYLHSLDHLITLHHHEEFCTENVLIYIEINITIQIKEDIMAELESVIEQKLIDQLVYGDSQWIYRADLKTEEDLWNNFRYILEQNNKDRLNGEPLSDTEFEQVKNQLQFSSFYKAGEWLVGENGKVMVHVQRDTERLHLVVMNHEHIAGGSSVYEVINQYRALADEESQTKAQDRRFDVTLMINGLPMIHIELKNKQHSYMDGFWQIKKYIGEGKFTGIFSAVQMFVISNGVDTKYFSAASDTELNPKFISGWLDNENNPVPDYLDFAKSVLRIPEAHEMIARYTVLDEEAKRLILLRPYQIHAIEAIREASKTGKSGFVWHTTGSGKTLTSYKATRNLLMDIPSIDKAIFLIDRKDLDTQTSMAFQTYANNDLVDVDKTDNVFELKKKLKSDDRQMIVTTIQKLQRLITKKLAEGTPEYNKIKSLKLAFVVDECHRAVTPGTKRELERFFANSLWYGFTGTPRFAENPYPQLGDLPRTTEELYGERLHRYTIQNAIHDNAVLGFQVEHNGPKNMDDETDSSMYENETHMLRVLDVILNKSYHKLGFQNGKGKTYEGLLTTSSIQLAQKYYELLKRVKNGETELQIDEKVKQILPDFPKFAITYSVTENEEGSHLNQEKMKESINDYNEMFGTKLDISQIQSYNANLNKRLARKEPKFQSRSEQLDLVIVVDRLLTGFDAPCMSTLFVDRQPMGPHDLIQAFSRTNRIFDKNKTYGQIVTFQAPKLFKECVDNAVKLYSAGSTEIALLAEWEEIEPAFRKALKALRVSAETPAEIPVMSEKEKVLFVKAFQNFDKLFAQLKSFTQYEDSMLTEYGISEDEYDDYAGHYLNVKEELKAGAEDTQSEMEEQPIDVDYELMAYSNTKIDYEYIINLIQNIVTPDEDVEITPEERQKQLEEVKQYIDDLRKENPKVADIMSTLVSEIEQDEVKYKGQSILNIVENMKHECIEKVVMDFSITWYVSKDDVMYAATHYRNGEIPNESAIKSTADFTSFKEAQERAIPKFKYYNMMIEELRKTLEEEIKPLLNN